MQVPRLVPPSTKTCRWGPRRVGHPLFVLRDASLNAGPSTLHPIDEDLSMGTPEEGHPVLCLLMLPELWCLLVWLKGLELVVAVLEWIVPSLILGFGFLRGFRSLILVLLVLRGAVFAAPRVQP